MDDFELDVSRRQIMRRAGIAGLVLRNAVNAILALVVLAAPHSQMTIRGQLLLLGLGLWSLLRLWSRSVGLVPSGVDYVLVLIVCVEMAQLHPGQHFQDSLTVQHGIAGTAVIGFTVTTAPHVSLALTVGIALAYIWGSATVIGLPHVWSVPALYLFGIVWGAVAWIRHTLFQVAAAVDQTRADRHQTLLRQQVDRAVRDYEREQVALLHDTAASTLLMVGAGAADSSGRLAARARRDVALLAAKRSIAPAQASELVSALRECAQYAQTPIQLSGRAERWLDPGTAEAVIAASREVIANVDRHSGATQLTVRVGESSIAFEDDGVGFDPNTFNRGHGVRRSILDRMRRIGGDAHIDSTPGKGTIVELIWQSARFDELDPPNDDAEQLIEHLRRRFGFAVTGYALTNLAWAVPLAIVGGGRIGTNIALGLLAVASTLAAIPGIRHGQWRIAIPAGVTLTVIGLSQPLLLPPELFANQVNWCQASIGWCLVPLTLGMSAPRGITAISLYWTAQSVLEIVLAPTSSTLISIGIGTGCIFGIQVFAIVFNGLLGDAAYDARNEAAANQHLLAKRRISAALDNEYERRFSRLMATVTEILQQISSGGDESDLRQRAHNESLRLRALFDQASTFDHPLMREVRRVVDAAEDRQLAISMSTSGQLPAHVPDEEISALVTGLSRVVQACRAAVRLAIATDAHGLSLSVVCADVVASETVLDEIQSCGVEVEAILDGPHAWIIIRVDPRRQPHPDDPHCAEETCVGQR